MPNENKVKYIIIADRQLDLEWEASLQESMGVCTSCKRAYRVALFLARIAKPDRSYRKILHLVKQKGAAVLKDEKGTNSATIVAVKIY